MRFNDAALELASRFELHRFTESTWLAEVELEASFDWEAAALPTGGEEREGNLLLSEEAYAAHTRTLPPGQFAEPPDVEWR